jgi:aspartate--ammonia ligase
MEANDVGRLQIESGYGLYTDMNAIRPDETLDNIHSLYVDQWDWERHITADQYNIEFLMQIVTKIYEVMKRTEYIVYERYRELKPILPENITFIHTNDLYAQYPDLNSKEREDAAAKKYGAIFIIGIGDKLPNGEKHDGRAPDYDDWSTSTENGNKGLNGDIVVWNPILERSFELSSMGIRVSPDALKRQLDIAGCPERGELYFHKRLLNNELPLSIGGGIGQSRLCMLFLRKAHIGEIQSSIWSDEMRFECAKHKINLV